MKTIDRSKYTRVVKPSAARRVHGLGCAFAVGACMLLDGQAAFAAGPEQARPNQIGLTVGVPFYDNDILHGDLNVDVRYGRKFGWLVPYVSGGFRQTRMDPARVPDEAEKKKLVAWHLTAGLRLEIPAIKDKLYPFVGVAGEASYWAYTADSTSYCNESFYPDAWRCYKPFDYQTGFGVKRQVGLLYKPEPNLAIEIWVEQETVHAPAMFNRLVRIVSPGLGMAYHF